MGTDHSMEHCRFSLHLFGGFEFRFDDVTVDVPPTSQRVLAFLALHHRSLTRTFVAGTLWPDTTDAKAGANLRTALWRLHRPEIDVVEADGAQLSLRRDVWVDAHYIEAAVARFGREGEVPAIEDVARLRGDLLPGFWDSWLVFERERLRQECIHLHEVISAEAIRRGDGHAAVIAALAAVECDPLRESSNALLIRAHVADNDRAMALRHYRRYAALLHDELGLVPSAATDVLLDAVHVAGHDAAVTPG